MSYFPIKIKFNSGEIKIINSTENIPFGVSFKVIETNVIIHPLLGKRGNVYLNDVPKGN